MILTLIKYLLLTVSLFGFLPNTFAASEAKNCSVLFTAKNYDAAMPVCTGQANQGNAIAQSYLGYMYQIGGGALQNDKQAVHWFTKAAEQGNAVSQYYLGGYYRKGEMLPQDDKQAAYLYAKAAKQGLAIAQSALGLMYYLGTGVLKDIVEAYAWLNVAAVQGNKFASILRDEFGMEMTPSQLDKAQQLSKTYYKQYVE